MGVGLVFLPMGLVLVGVVLVGSRLGWVHNKVCVMVFMATPTGLHRQTSVKHLAGSKAISAISHCGHKSLVSMQVQVTKAWTAPELMCRSLAKGARVSMSCMFFGFGFAMFLLWFRCFKVFVI